MADIKCKNVLFDLDGTLADTAPDLAYALNLLLQEQGQLPLPLDVIKPSVSLGGIAMIKLAFDIDVDCPEFESLRNRFLEIYSTNIAKHTSLFDGMDKVLSMLESRQVPWGIVTNKPSWLTQPLMQELKLSERALCIVSGDTVEHSKPHPAPLLHACDLLACNAAQTLYVGDARRDVEAGNSAAMTTIIASYGYIDKNDDIESWGANGKVNTPLEILDWVS
ncbi:MAG: HAD-IA family hydrolase [Gammaproteobacteria bacterium]|jgi:N-acetyl-D-muramate 6-phosphate phosphatase|nr:HAD-IA family hydrolase [Gammaproteobacteria bacterium]